MASTSSGSHAIEEAATSLTDDFASSYRSGMGQLVSFFRAKGIGPEEAADLAHETLLKTLVHLKRHGRDREDLGPLVRTIARNLVIERVRRAKAVMVPLSEEVDVADTGPGPADDYLAGERQEAVRSAIRTLSPRHRHVVTLWMDGKTPAEIARELGIKRNAVDAILHRARRNLATKLQGSGVLAWVVVLGTRFRASVRRAAHHSHTMEMLGQAAPAATGLAAALSLAAAMSFSTPPAAPRSGIADATGPTSRAATSTLKAPSATVPRDAGSVTPGTISSEQPPVDADIRNRRVSAGTTTMDPTDKDKEGRVGVDVWHGGGNSPISGPVLDAASSQACGTAPDACGDGE